MQDIQLDAARCEDPDLALAAEVLSKKGPELGFGPDDIADAAAMVFAATAKWFEADRTRLRITSVENKWSVGRRFGTKDVEGVARERTWNDLLVAEILDWKSSSNQDLDGRWASYYTDSWQKKIYAWHTFVTRPDVSRVIFRYRGVTRPAATFDEKKNGRVVTRELSFTFTRDIMPEVYEYFGGFDAMRALLIDELFPIWPRKMGPASCEAFGHRCPRYLDCRDYNRLAEVANPYNPLEADLPPASYSDMELFLLCPERARRAWLEGRENSKEGSLETRFGSLFHEAMAAVYRPLVEVPETVA